MRCLFKESNITRGANELFGSQRKKQLISNHRIKQTITHFSGIPSK